MSTQLTIGGLAKQALLAGKSGKETLAIVHRVFPQAKTTMKGIRSYASEAGVALQARKVVNKDELARVLAELKGGK